MPMFTSNPASIYVPLLVNTDKHVRQQAAAIFFGTYGRDYALTVLRQLLSSTDPEQVHQVRQALRFLDDASVAHSNRPGVYIECLGQFRVFSAGKEFRLTRWCQENSRLGWQKVQAALAYLVHCGQRGTTKAALGAAVWNTSVSPANVQRTLQALRSMLAALCDEEYAQQALLIGDAHCRLSTEAYHTDTDLFEQAFEQASQADGKQPLEVSAALYRQALHLYGGGYFVDVLGSETWAQPRRDMLHHSFLIAAEHLAEYYYTTEQYQQCALHCAEIFDGDEFAEEIVTWLIQAYGQLGRQNEIEQVYRRYSRATNTTIELSKTRSSGVSHMS